MNFFDRLYGILFQPVETIKEITRKKPFWQAVIVIIITGLLPVLTANFRSLWSGFANTPGMPNISTLVPLIFSMSIVFAIVLRPLVMFITTAIYHLIAEFMDSKMFSKDVHEETLKEIAESDQNQQQMITESEDIIGTGKGLYAGLSFATLPMIFTTLTNLLLRFTGWNIGWLFSLIFGIWTIVLQIIAIKENYKMNGGNAALTYFLPLIVFIIAIIILAIFVGASMVSMFNSIIRDFPMQQYY